MPERDHSDLRDAAEGLLRALEEPKDPIKQVLVYRRDLKMRKGKIAAQVAHASMKVFFDRCEVQTSDGSDLGVEDEYWLDIPLTAEMAEWVRGLFTKIVLTVDSEEDLLRAKALADEAGIPTALITDAGRTEFKAKCEWCGGLGHIPDVMGAPICGYCEGTGKVSVPTNTAIAIGPAKASEIDKITGPEGTVPVRLP